MVTKHITYLFAILVLLISLFFIWSWRYPINIGWKGEMPVGYYRFQVVTYQIADYGHKNNVGFFDVLGNSYDFFAHILGFKKLNIDNG
jgi:hypothetical protein